MLLKIIDIEAVIEEEFILIVTSFVFYLRGLDGLASSRLYRSPLDEELCIKI